MKANLRLPRSAADEQLEQRIRTFLHNRNIPGIDLMQVKAENGTVVLRGRLPSSEAKRLCLACCRRVAGVINVDDTLTTVSHG